MRRWALAAALVAGLAPAACGEDADTATRAGAGSEAPAGGTLVATLGDSITAGGPLWDPDPAVRREIGSAADERSQYQYWARRRLGPRVRFRNCGVSGERTDRIALRLDRCARGADMLIVQGGLNDIAQGANPESIPMNLRALVRRGRKLGLRVAIAELLPYENDPRVASLNRAIRAIGREERVAVLPFHAALEDPASPGRMPARLTIDGTHPSIAGYRRMAEILRLP